MRRRLRVQLEQAIARGEPNSRIMREQHVTYEQVQEAREGLDEANYHVDTPALADECERIYGSLEMLERERRRVHLDKLASFRRTQRERAA